MVALSGGVDSAVVAWLLREQGNAVQCLHMTNWDADDGYCRAAEDLQDARQICRQLDLPLHRVNFASEYRRQVFADFLSEHRHGRTPNPDVLCNREIKFGVMKQYAARLGIDYLATGHYARLRHVNGELQLLKGRDASKDQSYFLHALDASALDKVLFPLGEYTKTEAREWARTARLSIAGKKDSTGICFIGERPFAQFLSRYIDARPGPVLTPEGKQLGQHRGLAFYTLGQRQGLGIGGRSGATEDPWYVAEKRAADNALIVVQGHDHPLLYAERLLASQMHWINQPPVALGAGSLRCSAKTRYRQADQACWAKRIDPDTIEILFDQPQRSMTPGQYAVLYDGERCLGGGRIAATGWRSNPGRVQAG